MNYDIYNLILRKDFRKRPGMFIGELSPNSLQVFLSGYHVAMADIGAVEISAPSLQEFHDWIAKKFLFSESTAGWPNMILAITMGMNPASINWEECQRTATRQQLSEATYRCFDLIEEFLNDLNPASR